jgi:hypothetical protein
MKSVIVFLFSAFFILSDNAWELAKDKNGIKVYTRKKTGFSFKEFKAESQFKCTKDKIQAEFVNIEAMSQWYDMVEKVELLKKLSETEAIYKIYFNFPSPTTDRYSTIKAGLSRDKITGDISVYSQYFEIVHKPEPNRVLITNMQTSWSIKGSDNNLSIEHIGYLDPAGSIPMWMFNSGLSDGPYKTLLNLKKRVEK